MLTIPQVIKLPVQLWPWYKSLLTLRKVVDDGDMTLSRYVITGRITSVIIIEYKTEHYLVRQINSSSAAYLSVYLNATVPTRTIAFQGNQYIGINLSGIIKDIQNIPPLDIYIHMLEGFVKEATLKSF